MTKEEIQNELLNLALTLPCTKKSEAESIGYVIALIRILTINPDGTISSMFVKNNNAQWQATRLFDSLVKIYNKGENENEKNWNVYEKI